MNLFANISTISQNIRQTSALELSEYWGIKTTDDTKLFDWINLVVEHARKIENAKELDIEKILKGLIQK